MSAKYDFRDKVVIVTGSSSGIGAAIAKQFAKYGANVTIHGRNVDSLKSVAKDVQTFSGSEPVMIVGDLLEDSVVKQLVDDTVARFGKVDILVNNAGAGTVKGSALTEEVVDELDKLIKLHVSVPLRLIHLCAEHLKQNKGSVINISSIAAIRTVSDFTLQNFLVPTMFLTPTWILFFSGDGNFENGNIFKIFLFKMKS